MYRIKIMVLLVLVTGSLIDAGICRRAEDERRRIQS